MKAGELVKAGAIGKVIQTVCLGPHRMTPKTRPEWFFKKENYGGILTDIASHDFDQFLFFTGSTEATIVASQVGNVNTPKYPGLEDFGDVMVRGNGGMGYIRVDWFTPDGLSTWGDGRLTILGTDGFIEVRKNVDIAGRSGGNHLFLVDQKETKYVDCIGCRAAVRHAAGGRRAESHGDGDAAEARVPGDGAGADWRRRTRKDRSAGARAKPCLAEAAKPRRRASATLSMRSSSPSARRYSRITANALVASPTRGAEYADRRSPSRCALIPM